MEVALLAAAEPTTLVELSCCTQRADCSATNVNTTGRHPSINPRWELPGRDVITPRRGLSNCRQGARSDSRGGRLLAYLCFSETLRSAMLTSIVSLEEGKSCCHSSPGRARSYLPLTGESYQVANKGALIQEHHEPKQQQDI